MRRPDFAWLALGIVLLAGLAAAEDVVVATPDGTAGVDGSDGSPGEGGSDSSTATAVAPGVDPQVAAVAIGGDGGRGGNGGDEVFVMGPGAGGDGGRGGNALASATGRDATARVKSDARAGSGGDAGDGGQDSNPFLSGARGGRGGDGGSASATGQATAPGAIELDVRAVGGGGGEGFRRNRGGNGGAAAVSATALGTGGADAIRVGEGATGGGLPSFGMTGDQSGALGGTGGDVVGEDSVGGQGGSAQSQTVVNASSAQPITASDFAFGGNGGSVVGDVDDSRGGGGGNATSSASATGAADVTISAHAEGGQGGVVVGPERTIGGLNPGPPDIGRTGDGGGATLGHVYGESTGGGRVEVTGMAIGGSGLDPELLDQKSAANPGRSFAATGDAADVSLVNAVDGRTSGELHLHQTAVGGAGAAIGPSRAGAASSALARLASASALELVSQALTPERTPNEVPSEGDFRSSAFSFGGDGADAQASGDARNDAGSVYQRVRAVAGHAARGLVGGGDGGSAVVVATGRTDGDGQDIVVGGPDLSEIPPVPDRSPESIGYGAFGGRGAAGGLPFGPGAVILGAGGSARSESSAEALGASTVEVYDLAVGGAAGVPFVFGPTPAPDGIGEGGSASSTAIAESEGNALAGARAFGGDSFASEGVSGGTASARSQANGNRANASALARAGRAVVGDASAVALTSGFTGRAQATAIAGEPPSLDLFDVSESFRGNTMAPTSLGNVVTSRARLTGEILRPDIGFTGAPIGVDVGNTLAYVTGNPDAGDVDELLVDNPDVAAGFASGPNRAVETRGHSVLAAGYATRFGEDVFTASGVFQLEVPSTAGPGICVPPDDCPPNLSEADLLLGLLDPIPEGTVEREGSLLFRIFAEGDLLFEELFPELGDAFDFFHDNLLEFVDIELDADLRPALDVEVVLQFQGRVNRAGGFGFELLVGTAVVPEPSSGLLLAAGLVGLAWRFPRNRRR
ncbi:MAG: PEP-CTERM sorting domain-containing protein [Myxococcota bacterium]|nr:PEP-CTERM sorting domain-containing protein [Myxococcota bacterium]